MNKTSRIAVIGAGAVGSYYGGRLAEAGHDVTFLMRRDYDAVKENGLKFTSPQGDFTLSHPQIVRESKDIGPVEWVICSLKSTSIDDAQELVQPCVDKNTRIIVLMNGLGLEDHFAEWFGPQRIFGGMAFTGINRGEPGVVHHIHYGSITLGHYSDDPAETELAVRLWSQSKVKVTITDCLLYTRWEKLCWNIPFNGLAVAAGGITVDQIMNNPGLRQAARTIMEEVIASGNADLNFHKESTHIDHDATIKRFHDSSDNMGDYRPSTMIDFVEGKRMEIPAIFGEPLRRAQLLGVSTPQLILLTVLLHELNARQPG